LDNYLALITEQQTHIDGMTPRWLKTEH